MSLPAAIRTVPPAPALTVERQRALDRLRHELHRRQAEWRRQDQDARCPTGLPEVDRLLAGGFPKGVVTALEAAPGAGGTTLLARAVARATGKGESCAWVEGTDPLCAPALAERGVELSRLLRVRAPAEESAWAAQLLARSGAFSLVVVDVPPAGWSVAAAHRLADAARAGQCALVLLGRAMPLSAAVKLRLEAAVARPSLRAVEATDGFVSLEAPRRQVRLWVERSRQGGETSAAVRLVPPGERRSMGRWAAEREAAALFEERRPGPPAGSLPLMVLAKRLHTRPRSRWRPGAPMAVGSRR